MKKRNIIIAGSIVLWLVAVSPLPALAENTQLFAKAGSKVRIEGTSNIHDWQIENSLIGGSMEVGPNFPLTPGQPATPGKVEAKASAFVMVRSLKSIEKDGKPYSDRMDEVTYEHMKADQFPRIVYTLDELVLKEAAKGKDAPYVFDSKGKLAVAGVTNQIAMPVNVLPLADGKIKVTGTVSVKMTDFKIDPPAPKIALGMIKTGDDVKLLIEWVLGPKKAVAAK